MPLVTVCPTPNGSPMASTRSPTSRLSESLNSIDGKLAGGAEAEHDEIAPLVFEDDLGRELAPVGQGHGDLSVAASLNDVVVGDRKPFRAHQHARAERVLDTLARNAEIVAEQAAEERIVGKRRNHLPHLAADIDVDDGRSGALHDGCEGLLHRDDALRRHALGFGERRSGGNGGGDRADQRCHAQIKENLPKVSVVCAVLEASQFRFLALLIP